MDEYSCLCGARSDLGDITDHIVGRLNALDDTGEHRILGLDDPPRVAAARAAMQRRAEVRERIRTVLGVEPAELLTAIQGDGLPWNQHIPT